MTAAQRSRAGKAARSLLEFAWRQEPRDSHMVLSAIEFICRTYASDAAASAVMMRRVLEPARSDFRHEGVPWLARQVPHLIDLDADLVQEIYEVAYRHREISTAPTHLVASNILGLTSNRQQDFGMSSYYLQCHSCFQETRRTNTDGLPRPPLRHAEHPISSRLQSPNGGPPASRHPACAMADARAGRGRR